MKLVTQAVSGRRVPVLTCSALVREGLDEVWQAVLDHRAWLDETEGLDHHRAEQQVSWMNSQTEATLMDAMRSNEALRTLRRDLEEEVRTGRTSAMEASADFLVAFASAVPSMDWAHPTA